MDDITYIKRTLRILEVAPAFAVHVVTLVVGVEPLARSTAVVIPLVSARSVGISRGQARSPGGDRVKGQFRIEVRVERGSDTLRHGYREVTIPLMDVM